MKKLYIWGWHSKSQIDAIENSNYNVTRWFRNYGDDNSLNNVIYKPYHMVVDIETIPNELINIVNKNFVRFSEMYSRVNSSRGLTTQETMNIFVHYLKYFYNELKKNKPDYVLFSSFPHFGPDYALYLCSQILNIKMIITFQTLFPNRFFAVDSLEDFINIDKQEKHSQNNITVEKEYKKDLFYMKNIKNRNKKNCYLSLMGDMTKLLYGRSKPLSLTGAVQKFQECKVNLFDKYFNNDIDIESKYVYFPLQLQPEMTTSMLGDIYCDQLLALEQLSAMLPDGWKIYVKENPKQTSKQRGMFFFERLKTIPKVQYLSTSINTHYLIEHSQFVSVVTGTVGWEAISGGKNVLVFGNAWYASLPGVFKYNKDTNIKDILSYKINHKMIESKLNELLNRAYVGVIDSNYNKTVENYTEVDNELALSLFLKDVIR